VPRHRLSSYGRRAVSVAGPAIWNWLPDSLRDLAISRDFFKRSLKTFLFSAYSCTWCITAFWTMCSTNLLTHLQSSTAHFLCTAASISSVFVLLYALGWHDECQLLYHKWWSWWNTQTQSYAACCCTGDSQLDLVNVCLLSCS